MMIVFVSLLVPSNMRLARMVERAFAWSSPFNEPVCGSSKDRIYRTTRPVLALVGGGML